MQISSCPVFSLCVYVINNNFFGILQPAYYIAMACEALNELEARKLVSWRWYRFEEFSKVRQSGSFDAIEEFFKTGY